MHVSVRALRRRFVSLGNLKDVPQSPVRGELAKPLLWRFLKTAMAQPTYKPAAPVLPESMKKQGQMSYAAAAQLPSRRASRPDAPKPGYQRRKVSRSSRFATLTRI